MAHDLLWVSVLFSLAGVNCNDGNGEMLEFLQGTELLPLKKKMVDVNADDLKRRAGYLPTLGDNDWEGILGAKPIRFDENNNVDNATGTFFRSENLKARGSIIQIQKSVKVLPHKPNPEDPEGCGNPICVVLDTKPRRFKSLCKFKEYLMDNNRKDQINFVQKGDCYDIIDGYDGAKDKPWINEKPKSCGACAKNENCNGPVVFIVDIGSMLFGTSTAPGGGDFSETQASGQKLGGFPLEFPTICDAMKVFESNENLNKMTQVVGFITGRHSNDLFSTKAGDECLWTEYFDHDTPCNSENDLELFSDHYYYLQSSYTGPYRICLTDSIMMTEQVGGSEITQVDAKNAIDGTAKGFDGKPFKQVITATKSKLECINSQQTIKELPAPFIFSDDKNNTCLDYKARYCCKTRDMWKPIAAARFAARFPVTIPVGLAITFVSASTDPQKPFNEIEITVYPTLQKTEHSKKIVIKCTGEKSVDATIKAGQEQPLALVGTFKQIKKPDGSSTFNIRLKSNSLAVATIVVKTSSKDGVTLAVSTKITEERSSVIALSSVNVAETVKAYGEAKKKPDISEGEVLQQAQKISVFIVTQMYDSNKGEKIIEGTVQDGVLTVKKNEGSLKVDMTTSKNIWEMTQTILTTYGISTIVESPPTAILFHECEWRDWLSTDHPGANEGMDGEYELRQNGYEKTDLTQHVCGSEPSQAHYVDAVTREDLTPWYELKMGQQTYETFKLTPYFGYACKDANGNVKNGTHCKDMKIRYCCEKKRRASWGDWEEWSTCSATCDGGEQTRIRKCVQLSTAGQDSSTYNKLCHGQEDWHTQTARERFTTERRTCNVENCPVNANMGPWCAWSACTVTCGQGWKFRSRTCTPAENGGVPCPPKTDKDQYVQTKACNAMDCERYKETAWSPWSRCSATCDKGVKTRKRDCVSMNSHQVVSAEWCGANSRGDDPLNQQTDCKLRDCPVDGAWSRWSAWSGCSQNCVSHPESGKPVDTRAYIARERFCSNPMPRFNGKECPDKRNSKYEYNPQTDSQKEKGDCFTELSQKKPKNAEITPWCPENCIYTQWGQWSQCTRTCVPINMNLKNFYPEEKMTAVVYNEKPAQGFPTRARVRMLVREAKYNGECPELQHNFDVPSSRNGTVLQQMEECSLCKEHCTNAENPFGYTDLRQLEPLKYPTDDPGCVGYCPEKCNQSPPSKTKDCEEGIKTYLNEDRKEFIKRYGKDKRNTDLSKLGHCLLSTAEFLAYKHKQTKMAMAIHKKIQEIMESDRLPRTFGTNVAVPDDFNDMLNEMSEVEKAAEIHAAWAADIRTIASIWFSEYKGHVLPQWVDGIAGGAPCTDPFNSKTVSSWAEDTDTDEKEKKYTNLPYFRKDTRDCELIICNLNWNEQTPGAASECVYNRWSEWGQWSSCTIKCGDKGIKKRTRVCQNTCTKETLGDENCTPYIAHDFVHNENRTWTNSHEVPCDPCPTSVLGTWSTWTSWDWGSAPSCSEGAPTKVMKTRTRKCITGSGGGETCSPSPSGLTSGTEKEEFAVEIPLCKDV